jgi:hypothetical protein
MPETTNSDTQDFVFAMVGSVTAMASIGVVAVACIITLTLFNRSRVRPFHLPCSSAATDTTVAGNLAFLYANNPFPTLDLDNLDAATVLLSRRGDHAYVLVLFWRGEALIMGREAFGPSLAYDGFRDAVADMVNEELKWGGRAPVTVGGDSDGSY